MSKEKSIKKSDDDRLKGHGVCQNCNESGIMYGHHVIPKSMGGKLEVDLCGKCHSIVHDSYHLLHISSLTKRGLDNARKKGVILGRRKGSLSKNTKLEPHKVKIKEYLRKGVSKASIAKIYGVSRGTLYNFINTRSYFKDLVTKRQKVTNE